MGLRNLECGIPSDIYHPRMGLFYTFLMVLPKDIIVHHHKFIFKCLEYNQNRYITLTICSGNEDMYGIKFFISLKKKPKNSSLSNVKYLYARMPNMLKHNT